MSCDKTNASLYIFAGTSIPTFVIVTSKGLQYITTGLISGVIVGGLSTVGYFLYKSKGSVLGAAGNLTFSTVKSAICSI